jgi:iron complex outermembrane receptor protein
MMARAPLHRRAWVVPRGGEGDDMQYGSIQLATWAIALAVLCAPTRSAHAQDVSPGKACTATLDGHVVDAAGHQAVAGAIVRVDGEVVAMTDESGRFELTDRCLGSATIAAERQDFGIAELSVTFGTTASVELELPGISDSETIVIEVEAPRPIDMQSATTLGAEALTRTRGRSFGETLAAVPGVVMLRSSSGLAKPIVRGQFGRRLLTLVDGIRHRAQDWGLDHAPEIDPYIADSVTVVRGAGGVRYGPDAIGGAVLVDSPGLRRVPGYAGEVHMVGATNGHGGTFASRINTASARVPGLAGFLYGSIRRLAAPSTPDYPIENAGTSEWSVGASTGYRRGDAEFRMSYFRYQATLGVCPCLHIGSRDEFLAQLDRDRPLSSDLYRSDFEIDRPHQAVAHDLALARVTDGSVPSAN